jgi:hypothetical protein
MSAMAGACLFNRRQLEAAHSTSVEAPSCMSCGEGLGEGKDKREGSRYAGRQVIEVGRCTQSTTDGEDKMFHG